MAHRLEALDGKPSADDLAEQASILEASRRELDDMRAAVEAQARAHRQLLDDSEAGVAQLGAQIDSLARDVDERLAEQARARGERIELEDKAINGVSAQLREMQRSKASHAELMDIVAKLSHRPKPGQPVAVSLALTLTLALTPLPSPSPSP